MPSRPARAWTPCRWVLVTGPLCAADCLSRTTDLPGSRPPARGPCRPCCRSRARRADAVLSRTGLSFKRTEECLCLPSSPSPRPCFPEAKASRSPALGPGLLWLHPPWRWSVSLGSPAPGPARPPLCGGHDAVQGTLLPTSAGVLNKQQRCLGPESHASLSSLSRAPSPGAGLRSAR